MKLSPPSRRLTALFALAAATTAYADQPQGIWRFVDAQTIAVARLDLATYNHAPIEQWFTTALTANTDAETAKRTLSQLHLGPVLSMPESLKDAGATELFVVCTLSNIPATPGWIVIPIPAGANPDAIAHSFFDSLGLKSDPGARPPALLRSGSIFATVVGDSLILSTGDPARFQNFTPADRPELAAAFTAAGNASIILAIAPNNDTRQIIEQMLPQLPPPASVPSTVLTRGLHSAHLSISFPPNPNFNLLIQSDTPENASALQSLITKFLTLARQDQGFHKNVAGADQILDAITPKLDADHLTVSLDSASMDRVTSLFIAGLFTQRDHAFQMKSMSNLKQIGLALIMYANDHKGAYPDTLDQAASYIGQPPQFQDVTTDPLHPNHHPGYTYIKPDAPSKQLPAEALVAYESFDQWPGRIPVLFLDGHVELVSDQQRAQTLITQAKTPKQP
ncbi:MAG TPA: hypothetical protein VFE58_19970 [Tepidisphaeraceae bacterium]|jgi:prepilin-type processing-associated H-X9-DG protein|nr:hypothetical protein [Tepidisphaeraceae bacterium]